jgi:hypothetical protein
VLTGVLSLCFSLGALQTRKQRRKAQGYSQGCFSFGVSFRQETEKENSGYSHSAVMCCLPYGTAQPAHAL